VWVLYLRKLVNTLTISVINLYFQSNSKIALSKLYLKGITRALIELAHKLDPVKSKIGEFYFIEKN